ncbi:hypothetical protein [Paracoccus sp. (in: a-proteobacteria)]|uniref:hypothetical protein n=1 Tax=Paracoccus sp. TaxID=267 RepID=UPI003A8C6190
MELLVRLQIDWRWPVLFFGSAVLSRALTMVAALIHAEVSGARLPYGWLEVAIFVAVGATARSLLPSLAAWSLAVTLCRRLERERVAAMVASVPLAIIGWLNAVWLARSVLVPRAFGDIPISTTVLALPLLITVGLSLAYLIYHNIPAEALP